MFRGFQLKSRILGTSVYLIPVLKRVSHHKSRGFLRNRKSFVEILRVLTRSILQQRGYAEGRKEMVGKLAGGSVLVCGNTPWGCIRAVRHRLAIRGSNWYYSPNPSRLSSNISRDFLSRNILRVAGGWLLPRNKFKVIVDKARIPFSFIRLRLGYPQSLSRFIVSICTRQIII